MRDPGNEVAVYHLDDEPCLLRSRFFLGGGGGVTQRSCVTSQKTAAKETMINLDILKLAFLNFYVEPDNRITRNRVYSHTKVMVKNRMTRSVLKSH